MINPPCDRRWHAGACLTDDLPPQPVTEPHECRQPAGHPPPCRCHWCGTTTTAREDQPSGWIGTDTIRNPRLPTTRED